MALNDEEALAILEDTSGVTVPPPPGEPEETPAPAGSALSEDEARAILEGSAPEAQPPLAAAEMGEPGMEPLGQRFMMSHAKNFQEKLDTLKRYYPEGNLQVRNVEGEEAPSLVFRESPKQPWRKVDAPFLEKNEVLQDVMDFFGEDIGAIVGEAVATIGSKGTNLLPLMTRLWMGNFLGELGQEGIQLEMGQQRESGDEIINRARGKATIGAAAGGAGEMALRGVRNIASGRRLIQGVEPGAGKAIRAADRLNIAPPTMSSLSDQPLLKRLAGLGSATLPTIKRYVRNLQQDSRAVFNMLRQRSVAGLRTNLYNDLAKLERATKVRMVRQSMKEMKVPRGANKTFSESYQKTIAKWDEVSRTRVNALYSRARSVEAPDFDTDRLWQTVDTVDSGFYVNVNGEPAPVNVTGDMRNLLDDMLETRQRMIDEGLDQIPAREVNVGDEVVRMDSADVLNYWRSQLNDLSYYPPGERATRENGAAAWMKRNLSETLDAPRNTNPEFVRRWEAARSAAKDRFDILDKQIIQQAWQTQDPSQFVSILRQTGSVEQVSHLRTVLGDDFIKLKDAMSYDFLKDPYNMTRNLDSMDRDVLRSIYTSQEVAQLRKFGEYFDGWKNVNISGALRTETKNRALIEKLILNNDSASIKRIVQEVADAGGRNSDVGKSIRSALLDWVYTNSTDTVKGVVTVNENRLLTNLKRLNDSGARKLLNVGDTRLMADVQRIASFINPLSDAGISMAATSTASQLRGFAWEGVRHVIENIGVSKLERARPLIKFIFAKPKPALQRSGYMAAVLSGLTKATVEDVDVRELEAQQANRILENVDK